MRGKYDDIIGLSRPVSARHAPMSMENRAAQFSPFAALTGYDDAIGEAGRLTDPFTAPDEETARLISIRLQLLQERELLRVRGLLQEQEPLREQELLREHLSH